MLNRLSSFNMEIKEDDPLTRWNQKYLIPKSLVALQSNVFVSFTEVVKSLGTVTKRGGSAKRNTCLNKRGDEDYMPVWVLLVNSSKCPTPQNETWLDGTLLHRELPSSHPSPISKYATCSKWGTSSSFQWKLHFSVARSERFKVSIIGLFVFYSTIIKCYISSIVTSHFHVDIFKVISPRIDSSAVVTVLITFLCLPHIQWSIWKWHKLKAGKFLSIRPWSCFTPE